MKRVWKIFIVFVLISISCKSFAQTDYEWIKFELDAVLSQSQYKKLETAQKMLRKSKKIRLKATKVNSKIIRWRDKNEFADSPKKRADAMNHVSKYENKYADLTASEVSLKLKAYKKMYGVYKMLLISVRPRDNKELVLVGRELEAQALKNINAAAAIQRNSKREKVHKLRYVMYEELFLKEQKAIWFQLHAYAIYTQMIAFNPDDEFYGTYEFNYSSSAGKLSDSNDEFDSDSGFVTKEIKDSDISSSKDTSSVSSEPLIYKVQIIAVSKPLSKSELKKIYSAKEEIQILEHSGLYKYFAGSFNSLNEAEAFKNELNIPDSFIVAFKGDERVSDE